MCAANQPAEPGPCDCGACDTAGNLVPENGFSEKDMAEAYSMGFKNGSVLVMLVFGVVAILVIGVARSVGGI